MFVSRADDFHVCRARGDPVLTSRPIWLACSLALMLAGCAAKATPVSKSADTTRTPKAATKSAAKPGPTVPPAKHCGPVMDPKVWKIQCSNGTIAMMCRKSDPTDRRCACKRSGKYRWTYGVYCDRALPCYKRACR